GKNIFLTLQSPYSCVVFHTVLDPSRRFVRLVRTDLYRYTNTRRIARRFAGEESPAGEDSAWATRGQGRRAGEDGTGKGGLLSSSPLLLPFFSLNRLPMIDFGSTAWFAGYRCPASQSRCSFSHRLLFSSLPLRKSYEIRLEEFCYKRSIVWVLLERKTLDLLHPLHSDLEIQGYTISLGVASHGQAPCKGGQPRPGHLQGGNQLWPRPPVKGRPTAAKVPCKGAARCGQGQPVGAAAHRGSSHPRAQPLAARRPQGRLATRHLQGATASSQGVATSSQPTRGAPAARAAANKGNGVDRRSGCQRERAVVAYVGVVTTTQRG
ncbi:hypothetical protein BHE74_00033614, partial [Ensete ventricosum]